MITKHKPFNIEVLHQNYDKNELRTDRPYVPEGFIYFCHEKENNGIFSPNAKANFKDGDIELISCAQYLLYQKALLFNREDLAITFLESKDMHVIKRAVLELEECDQSLWNTYKFSIAVQGNYLKFTANPLIRNTLLRTEAKIIVNASPDDSVWGIGASAESCTGYIHDWKGDNLMGFAIMQARDMVKEMNLF